MRAGALIFGIAVSAVLLAAAGALYILSVADSGQHHRRSVELVRHIQLLSSDWSVELARVRSNPLADFDSLAAFIPEMARLKEELTDTAQRIPELSDRLASEIQAYLNAVEAKEERIERFKTGYAVVRNSRRYLPLATEGVLRQARASNDPILVDSISGLGRDMERYLAAPTETAQARLTAEIRTLRSASVAYPLSLANALANLLAHAEVLVARQRPVEELFEQATSNDISDLTDRLSRNLEFELGRMEASAADYEDGILAALAALLLFWILLALQQAFSGRAAASTPSAAAREPEPPASVDEPVAAVAPMERAPLRVEVASPAAAPAFPPAERDTTSALLHGFIVKCISDALSMSADEISDRMHYLRSTQQKIRDVVQDGRAAAELSEGGELNEQIDSISAIASSVSHKMNGIADLARRLEAYSGAPTGDLDRSMIDLNACIQNVIETAGAESGATVLRTLGDIPEIFASKTELEMLLREIVENAMAAVRELDDRKGIIKIDTARRNGEILITVIDNGSGIAPENRVNIFKPFYTTRDGAMGIGLALAGHLVRQYEGVIKINSLPGQGTVARIALPVGISGP